jgi:hypothetical protein
MGIRSAVDAISALGFVGNMHYCPDCMNRFHDDRGQHKPGCSVLAGLESDDDWWDEDHEGTEESRRDRARSLLLEGCGAWIDQWDHTSGSVITGWLVAVESVRLDGYVDVEWAAGSGGPTEHDASGLPSHRIDGMARSVSRDIDAMRIEAYVKRGEE